MKKLLRWKWELLLLLLVGIMGGLLSYWLTANPTSSFVRFLLSVGIFADGGFAVLVLRRLWRDKWRQALAKGSRAIASGIAKLFLRLFERWNLLAPTKRNQLGGKTTFSLDLSSFRTEKAIRHKPKKWRQLQSNRERMSFLYRHMMVEKLRHGFLANASDTPSELAQRGEHEAHETALFQLYTDLRYDERREPTDEILAELRDDFHIKQ